MADTGLFNNVYNPDVLSCFANLSNDEVFTPPDVVNDMLDMLPEELFRDPDTTFLDPACKTGVFLREIAKRLLKGLEPRIPDLQQRIDHIFQKQLFGIAITELTSLLSRRSLYCSKFPNGEFSVTKFDNEQGNIRYKRTRHKWKNEKCVYCGAAESQYKRSVDLETYAYEWIHTKRPEEIFKMKFDVIISNPPYQLSDGGHGASAIPIYQKFVQQAKKLLPRYMTMIIPSRWFAGGRGLDSFRDEMLNDHRIRAVCDFFNSVECFPGIDLSGGVCYFLWDRDHPGLCKISSSVNGNVSTMERALLEDGTSTFIRFNEAVDILNKIRVKEEPSFMDIVSANDPFGYDIRVANSYLRVKPDIKEHGFNGALKIHYWGKKGKSVGYISRESVRKGHDFIDKRKLFVSRSYGERGKFPYLVIGKPFIGEPGCVCTETYVVVGTYDTIEEAKNTISYMCTKFFRFLVMLKKNTQSATRQVYEFVPMQDFSKPWTDEELYAKYGLTEEEIAFIDSMIRPMDSDGDNNNA
ncbi:MAG: Eco57I restriction-modification methylase domain-containing protein [Eubacteriales bacterium]|jgi:site-specific DNA-methyltransferase (adenine-specific)